MLKAPSRMMIVPALLALLMCGTASSQTTKKKAKAAPANSVQSDTAKPAPVLAPAPPAPYAPVHWDPALPPMAYKQNDGEKIYAWIQEKLKAVPGKPDNFSTKEDHAQYAMKVAEVLQSIPPIAFLSGCGEKYDPERQVFDIRTPAYAFEYIYLKDLDAEKLKLRRKRLAERVISSKWEFEVVERKAVRRVNTIVADEFVFAYSSDGEVMPEAAKVKRSYELSASYRAANTEYTANVPMSSAEARENHENFLCLFVFSLRAPFLFTYSDYKAPSESDSTRKETNGHALYGTFDRLRVFNKVSGEVYVEQVRPGL